MSERQFSFGSFVMDGERKLLLKDGAPVSLAQRGLALLQSLLAADGRVVTKAELMDVAWPAQAVEESNLSVQIAALRKSVGTRPDGEEWIATVPRIGYQFMPMNPLGVNVPAEATPVPAEAADKRPAIAVLPFINLSISREQEFFADGMTEDIIAALSRIGELFVISRATSFAIKGRAMPAKEAAQELGVRYILEGSVRAAGNRLRVTAQLTDGHSGSSTWAERYEGVADDIFTVQDDITRSIAQALQVTLTRGDASRLWEGRTKNLKAWEKAVLGHQAFQRYTTADNDRGRRLLEEAVEADPDYAGAMALLGITHYWDARYSLSVDRPAAIGKAEYYARRIEAIDPGLGQLYTLKSAIAFVHGKHDEAVKWSAMAVERSPSDSLAHGFLGMFQIYDGQLPAALAAMKLAIRHCPYPDAYLYYYPAIIHMWLGQLDKALDYALENVRLEGDEPHSAAYLAAIHGLRGEHLEAERAVRKLLEATPAFGLRNIRYSELYRDGTYLERLLGVLRKAGLPS